MEKYHGEGLDMESHGNDMEFHFDGNVMEMSWNLI